MLAIGLFYLVEALRDQEGAHAIARHESQARLEEIEPPERGELVEHHQQPVLAVVGAIGVELLGQPPPDLVEHEAHERLGPRDVRRRDDEIERHRVLTFDKICDTPVAPRRDRRDKSEEHTSELQSLMSTSYAVICLK